MLNPFKNWWKKAAIQDEFERKGKFQQRNSFWLNSLVLFKYQVNLIEISKLIMSKYKYVHKLYSHNFIVFSC